MTVLPTQSGISVPGETRVARQVPARSMSFDVIGLEAGEYQFIAGGRRGGQQLSSAVVLAIAAPAAPVVVHLTPVVVRPSADPAKRGG